MRRHIYVVSLVRHEEGDVELGEKGGRENSEGHEEGTSEGPVTVETAKKEFRISLQKTFSDGARVEEIMNNIKLWEDKR